MESAPHTNDSPGPPTGPNKRPSPLQLVGLGIASSTPVSGFLSYAAVAIVFGESRLEGSGGLTALGLAVFAAPLAVGVLLILVGFVTDRTPSVGAVAIAAGLASAALMGLGVWSIATSNGDASIGGGLLMAASIGLAIVSVVLRLARRASQTHP